MRLATLRDGSRDGRVVLVNSQLSRAVAPPQGKRLQDLLDDWDDFTPALQDLAQALESGKAAGAIDVHESQFMAPLPRAYQWLDASGYLNHVELVRRARGVDMPPSMYDDPIMYQGGSDRFLAARDSLEIGDPDDWGADFEAEIVVVTCDVDLGVDRTAAAAAIRLVGLVNDVSLRGLIPAELAKGFGFVQGKPSSAFAPLLVTPDELGHAWDGAKLSLPVEVKLNGTLVGHPNAGVDLTFDFPTLIAHAAKTRSLGAGTIIGSGTVSNRDPSTGICCLAERRMIETIEGGQPSTPYLAFGDRVEIEVRDAAGRSVFGRIDQTVTRISISAPPRAERRLLADTVE